MESEAAAVVGGRTDGPWLHAAQGRQRASALATHFGFSAMAMCRALLIALHRFIFVSSGCTPTVCGAAAAAAAAAAELRVDWCSAASAVLHMPRSCCSRLADTCGDRLLRATAASAMCAASGWSGRRVARTGPPPEQGNGRATVTKGRSCLAGGPGEVRRPC